MERLIENYMDFISCNKTERLCAEASVRIAEQNGYRNIEDIESLKAGVKV